MPCTEVLCKCEAWWDVPGNGVGFDSGETGAQAGASPRTGHCRRIHRSAPGWLPEPRLLPHSFLTPDNLGGVGSGQEQSSLQPSGPRPSGNLAQ